MEFEKDVKNCPKDFSGYLRTQGVIACEDEMIQLYSDSRLAAHTVANILITGESGSGKDCMAKFIHNHSPRRSHPFIHVNCSTIPDNLFESEFFGYQPGAFTDGSPTGKKGLVSEAAGGTLFLDEIGEVSLEAQTRLLQVVQEHTMRSIGGYKDVMLDIRIISATNQDLKAMVDKGKFRLDLYYRLNVVTLNIPPLRCRKKDIQGLISSLIQKNDQIYKTHKDFTQPAMEFLMNQAWLGNIREIQNFMERLYVLEDSCLITDTLLKENYKFSHAGSVFPKTLPESLQKVLPLQDALAAFEKEYLEKTVHDCQDLKEAAQLLNIDLPVLMKKLKGYKILGL